MIPNCKFLSNFGLIIFLLCTLSCENDTIDLPIADKTPPQAVLIYPVDGISVAGDITVLARATDNEEVDSVQFYINQEKVGTDNSGVNDIFEFEWKTGDYIEDEFHFISIIAYDLVQNAYASFPVRIKADNHDNEPPTAFLLNPFSGQYVSGIVNITVEASDNDSIQYVSYYVNNVLQGYVLEPPYIFPWNTLLYVDDHYSIYVIVRDMSNNLTTVPPVNVIIDNNLQNDVTPPTGSIVSPPAGLTVSGSVDIIVSASDNRAMDQVAFSIDGNYITSDSEAPYHYSWDTTLEEEDTEHTLSVVLVDLAGNESPLNPISVFVDNIPAGDITPPVVLITNPVAGQDLTGTVSIEVLTEDDTGMDRVEFFINGDSIHTDTSDPFDYSWDTETVIDDMDHIIAVIGFDLDGNATLAPPIAVFVDNFDNIPPSGQIQNPVAGQTVSGTITIEISATDNIGVEYINLSIDGIPRDTLTTFPYTYEWDTTSETDDEDHVISIIVSDSSDNISYVPPVSVFVNNIVDDSTPPVGSISNPLSGQTVSGTVSFTVLAGDDFGVDNVEFFIDGESIGIDYTEPYQIEWDTTSLENESQHTLSAYVTDQAGHTTIAQPILVTISN